MIMDPSVPCNKSFLPIDASELSFIVSNGYSGVADVGSLDRMQVFPDVNGRIKCRWAVGGPETDFGYNLPIDMLSQIS